MTDAVGGALQDDVVPAALRRVLGRFTTGVVVVTARTEDGRAVGMTVNSLCSVSLDPPLVLFCAARASQLHRAFTTAPHFAVNILKESQKALSRRFSAVGADRFGELAFDTGAGGVPVLPDMLAVVECATTAVVRAGDHDIILGQVVALRSDPEVTERPLVFFAGGYHRLDLHHADWWTAFG